MIGVIISIGAVPAISIASNDTSLKERPPFTFNACSNSYNDSKHFSLFPVLTIATTNSTTGLSLFLFLSLSLVPLLLPLISLLYDVRKPFFVAYSIDSLIHL